MASLQAVFARVHRRIIDFNKRNRHVHASAIADHEQHGFGKSLFHERMAESRLCELFVRESSELHLDARDLHRRRAGDVWRQS